MASATLIKTCLDVLHFSGVISLTRGLLRGRGVVFCLHHILPATPHNDFAPNSNLETTPEFLGDIIKLVQKRGYETLSLADAVESLKLPSAPKKPFAVFTLDDGYKDNMIYGQPIFAKYNCPYTIFVAPGISEATTELWWKALELIIAKANQVNVNISGVHFQCATKTAADKNAAWVKIYPALRDAPEHHQRQVIKTLAKDYGFDLQKLCQNLAMNWHDLKTLSQDPLCTIGAHTINHFLVAKLDANEAEHEMKNSAAIIAEKLGKPAAFFAYPYGDEQAAKQRDFLTAHNIGFKASVTTRKGVVYAEHKNHVQALPRIMVSSRYNNLRYIDALISGAPTLLLNKFRKLNVS
jgi:peptidoglycan/xylan/chitin deacetylase (PgdA/CDA1 family)